MSHQRAIGRRVEKACLAFQEQDYETCLLHLFPAIDSTGKARRPNGKVGERIRALIDDQLDIITALGVGSVIRNLNIDGQTIPQILYNFARTTLAHEGEIDPRLKISENSRLSASKDSLSISPSFILGMIIAVVTAQENLNDCASIKITVTIKGQEIDINNLWGQEAVLKASLS